MARRTLTDKSIAALKVTKRTNIADPKLAGHYVRVTPNGAKTFVAVARDPRGKQIWHTIGSAELHKLDDARELARDAMKAIKDGGDRAGPESFEAVSAEWYKRHVLNPERQLRSARAIHRYLEMHILPAWGGRDFASINRGDVAKLLDSIEDNAGPVAATKTLTHLSSIFNWYARRHDNYISPLVSGMARSSTKERARKRILSDDEIRALWEVGGAYGAILKLSLLTAQRRDKVASMRWQDVSVDGVWTVATEPREKGNIGEVKLPKVVLDIIRAQPRFASSPFIFPGRRGNSHFSGFSTGKESIGGDWTVHDIRRTAKSLMAKAGVLPHISERVLGHAIGGVEGTYDRHEYAAEKAHALKALAGLLANILRPEAPKVVNLRG
jgi:integrase